MLILDEVSMMTCFYFIICLRRSHGCRLILVSDIDRCLGGAGNGSGIDCLHCCALCAFENNFQSGAESMIVINAHASTPAISIINRKHKVFFIRGRSEKVASVIVDSFREGCPSLVRDPMEEIRFNANAPNSCRGRKATTCCSMNLITMARKKEVKIGNCVQGRR